MLLPTQFPETLIFHYTGAPKNGHRRVREDLVLLKDYVTEEIRSAFNKKAPQTIHESPVFLHLQGEIYTSCGATFVYVQRFLEYNCCAILDNRQATPEVCVDVPGAWTLVASIFSVVT